MNTNSFPSISNALSPTEIQIPIKTQATAAQWRKTLSSLQQEQEPA